MQQNALKAIIVIIRTLFLYLAILELGETRVLDIPLLIVFLVL